MILTITTNPNPILRKENRLITKANFYDIKFQKFVKDLIETMYLKDGVGIAAPQVGKNIQVCIIAKKYANTKQDLILINPVWEKKTTKTTSEEEGCLSVPYTFGKVKRYKVIKVSALSENGEIINFEAEKFFARIIQHEIDHLNGVLFIDKAKNIYKVEKDI